MLRIGIVGTGWIARQHLRLLQSCEDVEVGAVCDLDPDRLQAFAAAASARGYGDWRQMLEEEDLGALFVCTPPLEHRPPAVEALARGLPLYLEKPIARFPDDAAAIVEAAEESGGVCAVGYQWHALDLLDDLRQLLSGQEIGLLLGTSIGPTESRPWFLDRRMGGGNLLERGSHHLDLARIVGGEVASVQASGARVPLARSGHGLGDIDDAVTVVLELASGALGTVVVAWTRPGQPSTYTLDVVASDSTLRLQLDPDFQLGGLSGGTPVSARAGSQPFERSVRLFLEAARAQDAAAVACTPADAARTLAVASAAERALESGRRVEVAPP